MQRNVNFTNRRLALGAVCAAAIGFWAVGCGSSSSSSNDGGSTTCDFAWATAVFNKYMCSQGGCHDSAGSAAGFVMTGAGWQTHLVDVNPVGARLPGFCDGRPALAHWYRAFLQRPSMQKTVYAGETHD